MEKMQRRLDDLLETLREIIREEVQRQLGALKKFKEENPETLDEAEDFLSSLRKSRKK